MVLNRCSAEICEFTFGGQIDLGYWDGLSQRLQQNDNSEDNYPNYEVETVEIPESSSPVNRMSY